MKLTIMDIVHSKDEIEELLNDEELETKKMVVFGKDNDQLLISYETKKEQLTHEDTRLEQVKEVAQSVRTDGLYSELKNANQRCLYLLDRYHIQKSIALDVIDEVIVQKLTGE